MATQSINFADVKDFVFNGVNQGFSKIELDGVRRWEKYQTTEQYQEWVSSGYNSTSTSWVSIGALGLVQFGSTTYPGFYWVYNNSTSYSGTSNGWGNWTPTKVINGIEYRAFYGSAGRYTGWWGSNPLFFHYNVEKKTTTTSWVDTSSWVDKTRTITAYYY